VLAWEFDRIPEENWDPEEPWNNWVEAIREIGNVITISDYATRVIKQQVGRGPRVVTIPAPVSRSTPTVAGAIETDAEGPVVTSSEKRLCVTAGIIDTQALVIDTQSVTPKLYNPEFMDDRQAPWDGHAVQWCFSSSSDTASQYLVGFYGEEDWGCWSKTATPSIILPWSISGDIELVLELVGYSENRGRLVELTVGDEIRQLELQHELHTHKVALSIDGHANRIQFSGIVAIPAPGARDHRTLGLGLRSLSLRRVGERDKPEVFDGRDSSDDMAAKSETVLEFAGTVYTSVFNPADGRKNWHDIVTAFCWAFRDDLTKTLVLKMSHHNRATFLGELLLLFSRLSPFECRIIAIHGFLSAEQLGNLVSISDYFVNASLAEGQCLPLLEFMAEGVPAISPDHTAMATYINSDNAFVVRSSSQPYIWPNDPRRAYRTVSNRINWDSLRQAYVDSARVLEIDGARYQAMSDSAVQTVETYYSEKKIARDLKKFLMATARLQR
jgi:glycosyltransferase involved in cell wall biosynthesis